MDFEGARFRPCHTTSAHTLSRSDTLRCTLCSRGPWTGSCDLRGAQNGCRCPPAQETLSGPSSCHIPSDPSTPVWLPGLLPADSGPKPLPSQRLRGRSAGWLPGSGPFLPTGVLWPLNAASPSVPGATAPRPRGHVAPRTLCPCRAGLAPGPSAAHRGRAVHGALSSWSVSVAGRPGDTWGSHGLPRKSRPF